MKPETREKLLWYLSGYASAQKMMLWNRQGEDGFTKDLGPHNRPMEYWCASVRIKGKQHGVIGPNGYVGQYTRKEAVAEAQGFLNKCRALLANDKE